jgi:DNA-binding NarL/FixJ family response regulator
MIPYGLNGGLPVGSADRTRVLIYDRNDVLRRALSEFVNSQPDLTTCGTADDPAQALRGAARLHPDVVVLGLSFPEPHEIRLIRELHAAARHTRVLVLSLNSGYPSRASAGGSGALGYVEKYQPPDTVLAAIRTVAAGRPYGVDERRE